VLLGCLSSGLLVQTLFLIILLDLSGFLREVQIRLLFLLGSLLLLVTSNLRF